MSGKNKILQCVHKIIAKIAVTLLVIGIAVSIIILVFLIVLPVRLDQYASTISSTIIGVIGTMFGLTAASYAFIWGELKNEETTNARLKQILDAYRNRVWKYFLISLIISFLIIISNLVLLGVVQTITNPTLFDVEMVESKYEKLVASYLNENYALISRCALIDLYFSIVDVILMAKLNYDIFARQRSYNKIAEKMLDDISADYNLELPEKMGLKCIKDEEYKYDLDNEVNKIYLLEIIINRILKNHEGDGDAYRSHPNGEDFLTHVVTLKLKNYKYDWNYISNAAKRKDMEQKCAHQVSNQFVTAGRGRASDAPSTMAFVKVYSDLIKFRNAQLVHKDQKIRGTMLKCTIKKRLLIFLMSHERFDGMDLANMSLSGADLRYSDFSGCNLKGVKLKGTDCRGADFSNSNMPGIHFSDSQEATAENIDGDVEISWQDDGNSEYDVYAGRQSTCLEMVTFADADVSRMRLIADGMFDTKSKFPFDFQKEFPVKDDNTMFSLRDTNFDRAKLFKSKLKNIDLSNSSIFNAQMFNVEMELVNSEKVNFGETVLTFSIIKYSCFVNASFKKAVMSDCNIYRSNFTAANLSDTNFSNSKITYCNFQNTICNNTSFKNIVSNNITDDMRLFELISFKFATLRDADFSGAVLCMSDFSRANVLNCNFTNAKVFNSRFVQTSLMSTVWNSTNVKLTEFNKAIMCDNVFVNVKFVDCTFYNCDFSNSIVNCEFNGGEMDYIKFCNVRELEPKQFCNIILNHVDFSGTGISKTDFLQNVKLFNCIFDKIRR